MSDLQDFIAPGPGVALVTLFDEDGKLLASETAELSQRITESGATSVLVAGTAGEFWTLTDDERISLVRHVRASIPNVPVFAHVGGVSAERSASLTEKMVSEGVNAILALPVDVADLRVFYRKIISASSGTPVFAYHLPRLGTPIPLDDLASLGVRGIKDSSGDGPRLAQEILTMKLETYTGAPALIALDHQLGGPGSITGVANVRPDLSAMAWDGDEAALVEIVKLGLLTSVNFPAELKKATARKWTVPSFSRSV
jgi:4-hydroxy-tetrahydrodipicolinate synthase